MKMLEYIIAHFCKNSKFINDVDGLLSYLNVKQMNDEEKAKVLLEVYRYNNTIRSNLKTENQKLQQAMLSQKENIGYRKTPTFEDEEQFELKKPKHCVVDVSNYISEIRKISSLDELKAIIPNHDANNNLEIAYSIILKLAEEMIEIKKMLYADRNSIDATTKKYFEDEIYILQSKIDFIKDLIKTDEVEVETNTEVFNDVVFLSTKRGNVCVYQDLKDIPTEQYDSFVMLLDSIRNGKFTNLRAFANNGVLKDLREVKYGQSRIVFKQVASNCYVIVSMFIKKVDKDAYYQSNLANRHDLLIQNFDKILLLVNSSEEYLEENRDILDDVYSILKKRDKTKKIGDINE